MKKRDLFLAGLLGILMAFTFVSCDEPDNSPGKMNVVNDAGNIVITRIEVLKEDGTPQSPINVDLYYDDYHSVELEKGKYGLKITFILDTGYTYSSTLKNNQEISVGKELTIKCRPYLATEWSVPAPVSGVSKANVLKVRNDMDEVIKEVFFRVGAGGTTNKLGHNDTIGKGSYKDFPISRENATWIVWVKDTNGKSYVKRDVRINKGETVTVEFDGSEPSE